MTRDSRPFLTGTPTQFGDAVPNIGRFTIDVVQGDAIWARSTALGATRTYNANSPPPPIIPCINPRCRGGGLNIETFVTHANNHLPWSMDESYPCNGHEGRQRRSCTNTFKITMRFEPKVCDDRQDS